MRIAAAFLISIAASTAWAQDIGTCKVFPDDHIWNARVDRLPVHPQSDAWIQSVGRDRTLRADFGSGLYAGAPIGIPFITVPADQARVALRFEYADESDPGPYPIPADAPIEGGPQSTGDRHVIVLDRDRCLLYEVYASYPNSDGTWRAGSGAIFDLRSYRLRPKGWTSADAAGLPILPGLVRYEEVASGEIRHALRFTVPQTQRAYLWPATHFASKLTDPKYPPMGAWFRLRADYDLTKFSAETQVILRALQKYGMILADNGSSWFLSGAPNERWANDRLRELLTVKGSDLEAVDTSSLQRDAETGQAKQTEIPAALRHAASGESGAIAPGQIISIYGSGLGPQLGVAGGGETLPTQLGGTKVQIGGRPAALLYVADTQVNAIVPYGLAGTVMTATVPIVVSNGEAEQLRLMAPLAETAPGFFRYGDGLAVSWNEDYSTQATLRGSVASLLATGEGETTRPELYGQLVHGELPRVVAPVRVWIGGVEGQVTYAGGAPGLRAGVAQINVRVAPNTPIGLQPVSLRIGSITSTAGPKLMIR